MSEATADAVIVGVGEDARRLAVLRRAGGTPGLFWLNGFRSEMTGNKAAALDACAAARSGT